MKNGKLKLEDAVRKSRRELLLKAGEGMAEVAEQVLCNALSDAAVRAESMGFEQEEASLVHLKFCRRVCELLEKKVSDGAMKR